VTFPPFDYARRVDSVRQSLHELGVDGLLVTSLVNVRYLTGFTGSAAMAHVSDHRVLLMTDGRYTTQAEEEVVAGTEIAIRGDDGYRPIVQAAVTSGRHGLEAEAVSWAESRRVAEWLPSVELAPTSGVVEEVRTQKDAGEMARLEAAVSIGDATLQRLMPEIHAGRTESQIAALIESSFRDLGASGPSFPPIVAAGSRSAMPHHRAGPAPLERGDLVVLDFGCMVDGYCSDMTRTAIVGKPTAEQRALYALVKDAQEAARQCARSGVPASELDHAAREVIAAAGHGDAFSHSLGHGVGLEIHEAPWARATSTDILQPDHVVTDEPGVYLAGYGGVRLEDMLAVTETGCRTMTSSPHDLDFYVVGA